MKEERAGEASAQRVLCPGQGSGVHHLQQTTGQQWLTLFNLISREIEKCIILVCSGRGNEIPEHLVNRCHKDFPGSPIVKTLPSKAGMQDRIPGSGS